MTKKVMETRAVGFAIRDMSEDDGVFTGVASATNVLIPGYNEIVLSGAFKRTLKHNGGRVPIFWQHRVLEWMGMGLNGEETKRGLEVEGELIIHDDARARTAWALMNLAKRVKQPAGISIGFRAIEETTDVVKGKDIRLIKEIQLMEYSIVPFPANPNAKVKQLRDEDDLMDRVLALEEKLTQIGEFTPEQIIQTENKARELLELALTDRRAEDIAGSSDFFHLVGTALREVNDRLER